MRKNRHDMEVNRRGRIRGKPSGRFWFVFFFFIFLFGRWWLVTTIYWLCNKMIICIICVLCIARVFLWTARPFHKITDKMKKRRRKDTDLEDIDSISYTFFCIFFSCRSFVLTFLPKIFSTPNELSPGKSIYV